MKMCDEYIQTTVTIQPQDLKCEMMMNFHPKNNHKSISFDMYQTWRHYDSCIDSGVYFTKNHFKSIEMCVYWIPSSDITAVWYCVYIHQIFLFCVLCDEKKLYMYIVRLVRGKKITTTVSNHKMWQINIEIASGKQQKK